MTNTTGIMDTADAAAPRQPVRAPGGKLGVLMPGLGAVASTFVAGVHAVRRQLAEPIGALSQLGWLPPADGEGGEPQRIRDAVPLATLDDLVFGGWDPSGQDLHAAARQATVLDPALLRTLRPDLEGVRAMPAVFDRRYVPSLDGSNVKDAGGKAALARAVMDDIERFAERQRCDRMVVAWCGSTEAWVEPATVHRHLDAFEQGLREDDPAIPPSMIYAYAALRLGLPFVNGAPNLCCDAPAMVELAMKTGAPIAGKDFKTGQTLLKTILAPGLQARALGVRGWFSTNILGNRDGLVLDHPDNCRTKQVSKLGVLDAILQPTRDPELYGGMEHRVSINYYPPHGDNKESWDNIDLFGWLGYPMQIKVDFLCRDSILAAPVLLDLVLFSDLAARAGRHGVQDWLSFYFKSPQSVAGAAPEHDLFRQQARLHEALRAMAGARSPAQASAARLAEIAEAS